ncbi:hypothetical protein ACLBR5_19455 [Escherichia coli]
MGERSGAIDKLWRFTAELFDADEIDIALGGGYPRLIHALYAQRGKPKFLPESTKPHKHHKSRHRTGGKKDCIPNTWTHAGRNAVSPACLARSAMVTEEMGMQRLATSTATGS